MNLSLKNWELRQDLKNFFFFLKEKNGRAIVVGLMILGLLLLPGLSYYQTLQNHWQKPTTATVNFTVPPPALYPENVTGIASLNLTARGIIVFDLPSASIIYEKNPRLHLLPASTTKIMTSLVALEYYQLSDILTVPKLDYEGQNVKLIEGEKITFENLLYALLVASAGDAAKTIASNYPGGEEAFVVKMNEKAKSLSLEDTHFVNPVGLDDERQYTSAFDLAILSKSALLNPTFAKTVSTSKITVQSVDGETIHKMENVNQLLGRIDGVRGIKTGWTINAGECLVTYIEKDGKKLIIVILSSQDRFGETEKLINWALKNFKWKAL